MEELTHWENEVNKDYLGSWDLIIGTDDNGKPIYKEAVWKIKRVEKSLVYKNPKAKKEELLIWFEEFNKPMIIHAKVNFKGLGIATGTPFIEKWVGKKICIYVEKNVKTFDTTTDALRIKPVPKRIKHWFLRGV